MSKQTSTISAINLAQFIAEKTDRNLFLTGKAGTGKTVFLKEFKEHTKKRIAVLAPTGISAINAGAQTIHSFFRFDFSPYIPSAINISTQDDAETYGNEVLREVDMIIIDEISMVRADLLDRIDHKLRLSRSCNKRFGGVQLLMIGDLFQLPPVVTRADRDLLDKYYASNYYFFNSEALKDVGFDTVCLNKVYRQSDEEFLKILDSARLGNLNWNCINKLNSRFIPDYEAKDDSDYITMVSLKRDADRINDSKLNNIDASSQQYNATINGKFPKDAYPVPENLVLKVGTQVMFAKNNYNVGYRNGTIGKISRLEDDYITVNVGGRDISVGRSSWENVEYVLDNENRVINEDVVGRFVQFPLKPAWAITVHKSQGLTFDNAVIDLPHTFESGQAYVAFSRCRALEGIVLKRKVNPSTFFVDKVIVSFYDQLEKNLDVVANRVSYIPFEWDETPEENNETAAIDTELAEALKSWRLEESRSKNLRAFQILTNRALNEIAIVKPKNLEQLGYISGVGLSTISKFGEDIIRIVNGGTVVTKSEVKATHPAMTQASPASLENKKSWDVTLEMYCAGKSVSEIVKERGLTQDTIYNHLMRFVDSGELDAHEFVSGEIIREVRVFKANNPECERLKEIFDGLGGKVSYSEIRFALKCL